MKWNVGTKIGVGFGLALVIYVFVGVVSYRSTTQLIETSDARRHTGEVLAQSAEILSVLIDVQSGQRGYVITGEDAYLEPYQSGLGRLEQTVRELRSLTADNSRQQRRLDALEPLIKSRLTLSREAIDVRRTNGLEAAVQLIKAGKGEANMDEIRKVVGEMQSDEEELLKKRVEQAQTDAQNAKLTIIVGTLTALVLATLAGVMLTRNIAGPLQILTAVAGRITVGDLSVKVPSDGRTDEVGVLARTFDRMAQSLRAMAGAAEQIAAGDLRSVIKP
ncbi:MAG: CHASE3 domain-containing protein, partial [Candidatus Didemnitutus sp.]|nr:CHASE3 domain-containing protein [Candidatus Didemnitutus sp.]